MATPTPTPAVRATALATRGATLKPFGKSVEDLSATCPWAIFPRKKLDVTYRDVAVGLRACLSLPESERDDLARKLTHHWDPTGHSMVTLSVRTGFDLLLQTLQLPRGSEVLCSAITIPDMLHIVRHHGLVPVPVDLAPETLAVDAVALERAATPATRAVLLAHIFGSRFALDAVLDFAERRGLLVIEDCAQAFSGMAYTGERRADVSLFSFGTIKTATSFGGALVRVKDRAVLDAMRRRETRYPAQTNAFFARRLLKYGFFHGVTTPAVYGLFLHACRAIGADHDQVITSAIRGFSGGDLVSLIRYRPSVALLGMLYRRLSTVDDPYIELRKQKSEQLRDAIRHIPGVQIPASHAEDHVYWLFPVIVPAPARVTKYMNSHGFDVTSGATQLTFVPSPQGPEHDPPYAKYLMTHLVYLPVTAETPDWALDKMVECFRTAVSASRL